MSRATITNMSCAPATSSTSMACRRRRPSLGDRGVCRLWRGERREHLPFLLRGRGGAWLRAACPGALAAKATGGDEANKPAEVEAIEAFLFSQAEFRHNVITHHCEIRWTEEAGFLPLTDRDVNTLWGRMNKTVGRVYLTDIYNVIHSEFVPLFNPFQSYFDHLPSWDGVSDPIGDLADTVHVKSDQAEFRDYFRKWFVGILPALLDDTVDEP